MPTARELVSTWGWDINEGPLHSMERTVTGLKRVVQAVFYGETAKKIWQFISTTAEAGHEAALTAQKIGMNTQALMGLQHAAYMTSVGNEELTMGLKFLSRHMFDASKGSSEAMRNFSILGVKVHDAHNNLKPVDAVLADIADKFAAMPDGAKKTALAVELFGRGGIAMIPMLNRGSAGIGKLTAEASRLGLVMNQAAIKQAQKFVESLKLLREMLEGIKRQVGVALLPIINQYIGKILQWVNAHHEMLRLGITRFFRELKDVVLDVWRVFSIAAGVVGQLNKALGGTKTSIQLLVRGIEIYAGSRALFGLVAAIGAVPAALLASVAVIYIIIDDLVGYFQGRKSVFGELMEGLKKGLKKGELDLGKAFGLTAFGEALQTIVGLAHALFGWLDQVEDTVGRLKKPLGDVLASSMGGIAGFIKPYAMQLGGSILGVSPGGVPASAAAAAGAGGASMTYAPVLTLNFPAGMQYENPHAISRLVREALDSEYRKALKDFPRVVER